MPKSLRAWDESDERRWWMDSAAELVETTRVEHRTGIEGWFEPPGEQNISIPETVVPPRWKQAVSIFLPFFPLSLLSNFLLVPLLKDWPLVFAVLLNICILTPLMTYIFLPATTRCCVRGCRNPGDALRSKRIAAHPTGGRHPAITWRCFSGRGLEQFGAQLLRGLRGEQARGDVEHGLGADLAGGVHAVHGAGVGNQHAGGELRV